MKIYNLLNKFQKKLITPYLFSSIVLSVAEIIYLISLKTNNKIGYQLYNFCSFLEAFVPYIFVYFITLLSTEEKRGLKSFWSLFCLLVFSSLYVGSDSRVIIPFSLIISIVSCVLYKEIHVFASMGISLLLSSLLGILFRYLTASFNSFVLRISQIIAGKGIISSVLFSIFKVIFSLFDIKTFDEMFHYKMYGGSVLVNEKAVSGIINLFNSGYRGELLSVYSSGGYLFLIALIGISVSLFTEIKNEKKYVLLAVAISSVLSGNPVILLMLLFFESPYLILICAVIYSISSVTSSLLDLRIGIVNNGGIFELFSYMNKPVYFLTCAIVIFITAYFMAKYAVEKVGISDRLNIYYPSRLSSTVKALGGVTNIVRIKENSIQIRNPKLIDEIKIDCEIKENFVIIEKDLIDDLKEYLQ